MALLSHLKVQMAKCTQILSGNVTCSYIVLLQSDIRKNPVFRQQFHEMCAKVGVDPLESNKGVQAELLGIDDFYYEVGWHTHLSFLERSSGHGSKIWYAYH